MVEGSGYQNEDFFKEARSDLPGTQVSFMHATVIRNKRSLVLDIRQEEAASPQMETLLSRNFAATSRR